MLLGHTTRAFHFTLSSCNTQLFSFSLPPCLLFHLFFFLFDSFLLISAICLVYSYIMYSVSRGLTAAETRNKFLSGPLSLSFLFFVLPLYSPPRVFRPPPISAHADTRSHTRVHAPTHTSARDCSRSLANDIACPMVINHLSSRYRRISSVVSMRVQGSPPFLPLLPSGPC